MLNFFRRIRRKILDEGNLKKYLIYAIGEILLVMIGILLALQVNNWNTSVHNRIEEKEILTDIKDALKTDLESTIKSNIQGCERIINLTNLILKTSGESGALPDSIEEKFIQLMYFQQFRPVKTPYQILESKGLDIIKNKNLKTSIVNLYNLEYEQTYKRIENANDNLKEFFRPLARKYFKISTQSTGVQYQAINESKLLRDTEFMNAITIKYINSEGNRQLLERLKIEVESVINEITEEFKKD